MNEELPEIKAVPASSEEKSWIEYQRTESQGTLKRLEETAKYLSGLSAISLTIILGPDHEIFKALHHSGWLKAGMISWLLSIVLTLAVVFPFRYGYIANSYTSIRKMHRKIARLKLAFLIVGTLLYLVGISILAWLY